MRHSLTAKPLKTLLSDDEAMNISSALNMFGLIGSSHHHEHDLHNEDRVRISRSRRAIELQDQELMQLALVQERQHSA